MSWIDQIFLAFRNVTGNGSAVPSRPTLNFIGGTLVDDPANNRVNYTPGGGGGSTPTGTGFVHVTSGVQDGASKKVALNDAADVSGTLAVGHGGTGLTAVGSKTAFLRTTVAGTGLAYSFPDGDVRNYGAVGDSSTDSAPGFADAFTATMSQTGGEVVVPPDAAFPLSYYRWDSSVGTVDLLGKGIVRWRGSGGVIQIGNALSGSPGVVVGNTDIFDFQNLQFLPQLGAVNNCTFLIQTSSCGAQFAACSFYGIGTTLGLIRLYQSRAHVKHCFFAACHAADGAGVVTIDGLLDCEVSHTTFLDVANFLDWSGTFPGSGTEAWIRCLGPAQYPTVSGNGPNTFHVHHCTFDEGATYGVYVKPTTSDRLDRVLVEDCQFNVASSTVPARGVKVVQANNVIIQRCGFGFANPAAGSGAIECNDCTNVLIQDVAGELGAKRVIIDSDCVSATVVNCRDIDLTSFAAKTTIITDGSLPTVIERNGSTERTTAYETIHFASIAGGGGTDTHDFAIGARQTVRLEAIAQANAGTDAFCALANATVVLDSTGAASFAAPVSGGTNPSDDPLGEDVCDAAFSSGGGDSTIAWTVIGNTARLTITNQGALAQAFDVQVKKVALASVPGLTVWLDDTSIVNGGGLVATWSDKSGNGNDVAQSGAARPIYNATANNGLPGIQCTGTEYMQGDSISGLDFREYTIFTVGSFTGNLQCHLGLGDNPGTAGILQNLAAFGSESVIRPFISNTAVTGILDGSFHVRTIAANADGVRYWQDASLVATDATVGIANVVASTLSLGALPGGGTFLVGYLQAVLIWPRILSDDEIASIQAELKARYATP